MGAKTSIPKQQWSPDPYVADQPPPEETELLIVEVELLEAEDESSKQHPHNFDQYREQHSRCVAKLQGGKPAYIGYAFIPEHPHGVCH